MVGKTVNKSVDRALFEITPEIQHFAGLCEKNNAIDKELYTKYEVKRGLRDLNGKGVLAGLTNISDVCAKKIVNGEEVPCAGNLYYRRSSQESEIIWSVIRLPISKIWLAVS